MSWLSSPLHDSLDIAYCSNFFGEIPNYCTNAVRDPQAADAPRWPPQIPNVNNSGLNREHRLTRADVAMALGAGRAAGLIPQPGLEAFNKVRTSGLQSQRWPLSISRDAGLYQATPPAAESGFQLAPRGFHIKQGFDTTCNAHPPVALTESMSEKFRIVDESSGALDSKSPHASVEDRNSPSTMSYMTDSFTSAKNGTEFSMEATFQLTSQERRLHSMLSQPSKQECKNSACPNANTADVDESVLSQYHHRENAGWKEFVSNQPCAPVGQLQELVEPSVTVSETADSKTTTSDRSEEDAKVCGKRKGMEISSNTVRANEDSQTETVDETKSSTKRKGTSRRNRAAEVHNLSERRRRDRINKKMRALQELIPNSSKTDKASMLDEAIEYLKTLQQQLQLMSMRSGLSVPSAIMFSGMQMESVQHPQLHPLPQTANGMGMGLCIGLGVGVGDLAIASSCQQKETVPPLQSPASYPSSSALAPSSVEAHERLQGSNFLEPLNPYSNCQQLQLPIQPVPLEEFNQNDMNQHVEAQSGLQQVHPLSDIWQLHQRQPFLLQGQHMQVAETQHQLSESSSYEAEIP